jgi:lipoprotein-anchoring transpeptidase ErfK/SrfK
VKGWACSIAAFALLLAGPWLPATAPPSGTDARSAALPSPGYLWFPELAPKGPVVIVISLLEQKAYAYRNGIRIGVANISSGRRGYETPAGVFTILQKHREHYSNLYDDAPMPYMQRLTWSGVALHAGKLPGYPASHGCIRLPYPFAEKLYGITATGMTVVVANGSSEPPGVAAPGLFSPVETGTGLPRARAAPANAQWSWRPELAPAGPMTIVLSTHDREMVVMRNAVEIGRATIDLRGDPALGTKVYVLLQGAETRDSELVPGRPALRWQQVDLAVDGSIAGDDIRHAVQAGTLSVPVEFARQVYDALSPGATVVVTSEPTGTGQGDAHPVIDADGYVGHER